MDIPENERVADGHNAEGSQVVPAEAHGDEHEVCVIFLVPFGSSKRWEQHKPDLAGYTEKPALVGPEQQARLSPRLPLLLYVPHCLLLPIPLGAQEGLLHRRMALILALVWAYLKPHFRGL